MTVAITSCDDALAALDNMAKFGKLSLGRATMFPGLDIETDTYAFLPPPQRRSQLRQQRTAEWYRLDAVFGRLPGSRVRSSAFDLFDNATYFASVNRRRVEVRRAAVEVIRRTPSINDVDRLTLEYLCEQPRGPEATSAVVATIRELVDQRASAPEAELTEFTEFLRSMHESRFFDLARNALLAVADVDDCTRRAHGMLLGFWLVDLYVPDKLGMTIDTERAVTALMDAGELVAERIQALLDPNEPRRQAVDVLRFALEDAAAELSLIGPGAEIDDDGPR